MQLSLTELFDTRVDFEKFGYSKKPRTSDSIIKLRGPHPFYPHRIFRNMTTAESLSNALDLISKQLWDISLDNTAFPVLKQKVSKLSAQIAVHRVMEETASQLLGPTALSTSSNMQNRLGKFLDTLYGSVDKSNVRWEKLLSLDLPTLLFITISYTPLEVTKMHRTDFDYLIDCVPRYLNLKLKPRWMFRNEIRVTLATKADLPNISPLRKS
jgi:hypothetical protein